MKSAENQNKQIYVPESQKRIRNQLSCLLRDPYLRGKFKIIVENLPQQLEIILIVPVQNYLQSQKHVRLIFMFGDGYPEDPPAIFILDDSLSKTDHQRNILNYEDWRPTTTIQEILQFLLSKIRREGYKEVIKTLLPKKQRNNFVVSQQIYQSPNNRLQKQNQFFNFLSPDSCFKLIPSVITNHTGSLGSSISEKQSLIDELKNQSGSESDKAKEDKKKKKEAKPMNKNANLPKFLIRIFIKYLQRFKEQYSKKQYDKLQIQCRKMKQWKRTDKKQHAFGLKHLKKFFQDQEDGYPSPDLNRKVITHIIKNYLLQQICSNSQIPETHQQGYLTACRVYSLRCRNSVLAGRIQSK